MVTNKEDKSGKRQTYQKLKIAEYLRSVKSHPTAEMVYSAVKKDIPTISLGTVYRNLNLLAEQGEATKITINNEAHFDGQICNHQHFVCRKCGKIIDIPQEEISGYAMKKVNCKGFRPICVSVKFTGYCNKCDK